MEGCISVCESILSIQELEAQITALTGHLNAANYRWLKLIAEFDRRNGWSGAGTQSCAHWLNWKCGMSMGVAREKLRVAHALEKLPKVAAAMAKGQLSYSKVREVTRVASEPTEDYFLDIALHGTAHHVEKVVRYFRRAKEAEELSRAEQQQINRFVSYQWDDDGSLILKARLPAEAGALVLKALDAAMEEFPLEVPADIPAGTPTVKSTSSTRRADALGLIAESFLKHGVEEMHGGERHQVVVHIDAETLRDNTAGQCEIEDGPSVSAETVRRFCCDASIVAIVENDNGEPLNVGRKTRSIPPALKRALNARDQGCRFPGCCNKRYIDGHHIEHWANGGETKLSNLVTLCRFHHRLVHEGGIQIQILDDGAFRFIKADGQCFDSVATGHTQPISDWTDVLDENHVRGIHVDKHTAITKWCGEKMDFGIAVEVLLHKDQRAKHVSS